MQAHTKWLQKTSSHLMNKSCLPKKFWLMFMVQDVNKIKFLLSWGLFSHLFFHFTNPSRIKKKQEKAIRIELNYFKVKKERQEIGQKLNELITSCQNSPNKNSQAVPEHILLHFWTVRESNTSINSRTRIRGHLKIKICNDETETEAHDTMEDGLSTDA